MEDAYGRLITSLPAPPGRATYVADGLKLSMPDGLEEAAIIERFNAYPPPGTPRPPAPPPEFMAKSLIIRRLSEEERQVLIAALAAASATEQLLWQNAHYNEVPVAEMLPFATALFGEARAAEILAPPA